MILSFAPMEGVTGADYRCLHHRMFPGADQYYAPFIAPDAEGNFKLSHLRGLLPDNNKGLHLVPQVLTNSPTAFLAVARKMKELGYEEVNLNAGCPSGTVVSKHKGAGMLGDPAALDAFLYEVFAETPVAVSVKTRLGLMSTEEFPALLEVYHKYPLSELIVHARDRAGMYRSEPDVDAFARAMKNCRCPICYNGNVFTPADLERLRGELPGLERVMLGRGAAANPALFRQLRGGAALSRGELREFHDSLLDGALASGLSPHFAMARMKELWYYLIWLFPNSAKLYKSLNKSQHIADYCAAAAALFANADFDPNAGFGG